MTDEYNSDRDPKVFEDNFEEGNSSLTAELYSCGVERLYKANFLIIPDSSGRYAYHRVYHLEYPQLDEINFPDTFKVWSELSGDTIRAQLQQTISSWGEEDLKNFWWPFIKPNKHHNSPLYTYTEILLNEKGIQEKKNSGQPLQYLMTPDPVVPEDNIFSIKSLAPVTFIPKRDWFPESVKTLTIYDYMTIFPEVEAKLLALILGRAVVGRSNHLPPGFEKPIIHTSRMAALTLGEDPGMGKTTLFKALFEALERCGYVIETFDKFNSQFNMGPIITAHIVYRDDLSDKDLKSLTESGVAKSTISGSDQIKVQDKGVDAHNVYPRATIIANTNNFNPRLIWGLDPGFADRLKLISTVREAELRNLNLSEMSSGTPDCRPFVHLEFLAKKCGVSKTTLMLWLARLCADMFLESIKDRTSLEYAVDKLTLGLREPLHKDTTSQFFTSLMLSYYVFADLGRSSLEKQFKDIGGYEWQTMIEWYMIVTTKRLAFRPYLEWLKKDFDSQDRPDYLHPYIGYNNTDYHSVKNWVLSDSPNFSNIYPNDKLAWLEKCFKVLRLKNGLPFSSDPVWLNKAFSKIYYHIPLIRNMGDKIREEISIPEILLDYQDIK